MDVSETGCPTCNREAGHSPAVSVIEYALELRAKYPDAYVIVDLIKKQWREAR